MTRQGRRRLLRPAWWGAAGFLCGLVPASHAQKDSLCRPSLRRPTRQLRCLTPKRRDLTGGSASGQKGRGPGRGRAPTPPAMAQPAHESRFLSKKKGRDRRGHALSCVRSSTGGLGGGNDRIERKLHQLHTLHPNFCRSAELKFAASGGVRNGPDRTASLT